MRDVWMVTETAWCGDRWVEDDDYVLGSDHFC